MVIFLSVQPDTTNVVKIEVTEGDTSPLFSGKSRLMCCNSASDTDGREGKALTSLHNTGGSSRTFFFWGGGAKFWWAGQKSLKNST